MLLAVVPTLVLKVIGPATVDPTSRLNVNVDGLPVKLNESFCCSKVNWDVKNEEGMLMSSETWGP